MKKLFVLSAICIITMLFTNKAMSQVVASGTTGACTWELTGTFGNYTLTISGSGGMGNYTGYDSYSPWYSYRTGIKTLDLQQGVTTIGDYAFFWCGGLTSVTIPNSVTTIGNYAFADCSGLTSVTIGNSVTTIGNFAFYECSGLTSIDVEASNPNYSSVNGVLFNKLQNVLIQYPFGKIGDYTIPNSVTSIGNSAFYSCSGLTSVTIGNLVTSIGDYAFYSCSGLTSVTIGNSVTFIGHYAFIGCSGLTSVTIPNSVTSIGLYAFSSCSGLTSIDVDASNPNYSSVNGVLFNKLQNTLIQYPSGKIGDYTIPNSVTSIGDYAFSSCSGLTSVTIGNMVTSIGNYAFAGCSLTELYVKAQTPPALGNYVFFNVHGTIPLHVPCGTTSAYQSASGWSGFSNYTEDILLLNLTVESNDATMGTANITQSNTCTDNTAIIEAVANQGYRFVQWNDGNTQNPRTITITQDITYTAIFDTETGIPMVESGHALSLPQIYPNPATDNINITLPENRHQALFTLYDMQGKALIRKEIGNRDVVSVSGLAAGIYFYNVRIEKQSYQGKLIINN